MEKGRTEPALAAMFERMYRMRVSRLIRPEEITPAVLDAVRNERWSVRLPRRLSPASLLADVPRRMPWLLARGLTTPPRVGRDVLEQRWVIDPGATATPPSDWSI